MLKLATVFSGIGAIEHALKRMGIEHQIVFACDNGGINIFDKKIDNNMIEICKEIQFLKNTIQKINIDNSEYYINFLEKHLNKIEDQVLILEAEINNFQDVTDIIEEALSLLYTYNDWKFNNLKTIPQDKSIQLNLLNDIKNHIRKKITNVPKLKNCLYEIEVILNKDSYKSIKKQIREIINELKQLHEKIGTLKVLDKLSKISDYKEKKQYVDSLYKKHSKKNFVKESYFANYDIDDERFHYNVAFLDGNQYRNQVDLFVGGSPCQSFSLVGSLKGLEDTRGTLFYEFARLVHEIQPKVFIYENVKNVLSHDNKKTWKTMTKVFNELNYNWKYAILNAKDYGIPQNRERLFVVGFRDDLQLDKEFEFPPKIILTKKMKDFLLDNVSGKYYLNEKGVKFVTSPKNLKKRYTQIDGEIQLCQKANQQFNWHGDFVFVEENKNKKRLMEDLERYFLSEKVKKYVLSSGTKKFYSKPQINLEVARPLLTTMHKMHRAGVDNYVETEGRLRKLTPRECLRLMGFCDSFKQVVSDTQMYQQAGNSIVVDVLIHIMIKVIESLPQIRYGSNYKYIKESSNDCKQKDSTKQMELFNFIAANEGDKAIS